MEKFKLNYEQKKELAEWIATNNNAAITGSIMLRERGIELGREPDDIDIIIKDNLDEDELILPPLVYNKQKKKSEDGYSVFTRCWFGDTKIEFIADSYAHGRAEKLMGSALYCTVDDLLAAKEEYTEQDTNADYIEKSKHDIEIIKKYQSQFPIIRYRVGWDGHLAKVICNTRTRYGYKCVFENLMNCTHIENWNIKTQGSIKDLYQNSWYSIISENNFQDYYKDFEEAKKVSKERWDETYAPNALYRVVCYFDDVFDKYITEPIDKKTAYERACDLDSQAKPMYYYSIEKCKE